MGQARLKLAKNGGAVDALKAGIPLLENRLVPKAKSLLGEALFNLGQFNEAIRELRASVKATGDVAAVFMLASAYQGANDHDAAARVLSRALADDPSNGAARVQYVRSLVATGRNQVAAQVVARLEKDARSRPELEPLVKQARSMLMANLGTKP